MDMDDSTAPIYRIKLREINRHLICRLCRGYYVDATTIAECLHSFCRSCIIKYLEDNSFCPICEVQINNSKPYLSLRLDKALQDVVYKVVPRMYHNEMGRRRAFYENRKDLITKTIPEQSGMEERIIFDPDDCISISIEYLESDKNKKATSTKSVGDHVQECSIPEALGLRLKQEAVSSRNEVPYWAKNIFAKRYFQCPAMIGILQIKKLLRSKLGVDESIQVDVIHKQVSLMDHYTLMDVAYIYTWKRNSPMKLFYQVTPGNIVNDYSAGPGPSKSPPKLRMETLLLMKPLVTEDSPMETSTSAEEAVGTSFTSPISQKQMLVSEIETEKHSVKGASSSKPIAEVKEVSKGIPVKVVQNVREKSKTTKVVADEKPENDKKNETVKQKDIQQRLRVKAQNVRPNASAKPKNAVQNVGLEFEEKEKSVKEKSIQNENSEQNENSAALLLDQLLVPEKRESPTKNTKPDSKERELINNSSSTKLEQTKINNIVIPDPSNTSPPKTIKNSNILKPKLSENNSTHRTEHKNKSISNLELNKNNSSPKAEKTQDNNPENPIQVKNNSPTKPEQIKDSNAAQTGKSKNYDTAKLVMMKGLTNMNTESIKAKSSLKTENSNITKPESDSSHNTLKKEQTKSSSSPKPEKRNHETPILIRTDDCSKNSEKISNARSEQIKNNETPEQTQNNSNKKTEIISDAKWEEFMNEGNTISERTRTKDRRKSEKPEKKDREKIEQIKNIKASTPERIPENPENVSNVKSEQIRSSRTATPERTRTRDKRKSEKPEKSSSENLEEIKDVKAATPEKIPENPENVSSLKSEQIKSNRITTQERTRTRDKRKSEKPETSGSENLAEIKNFKAATPERIPESPDIVSNMKSEQIGNNVTTSTERTRTRDKRKSEKPEKSSSENLEKIRDVKASTPERISENAENVSNINSEQIKNNKTITTERTRTRDKRKSEPETKEKKPETSGSENLEEIRDVKAAAPEKIPENPEYITNIKPEQIENRITTTERIRTRDRRKSQKPEKSNSEKVEQIRNSRDSTPKRIPENPENVSSVNSEQIRDNRSTTPERAQTKDKRKSEKPEEINSEKLEEIKDGKAATPERIPETPENISSIKLEQIKNNKSTTLERSRNRNRRKSKKPEKNSSENLEENRSSKATTPEKILENPENVSNIKSEQIKNNRTTTEQSLANDSRKSQNPENNSAEELEEIKDNKADTPEGIPENSEKITGMISEEVTNICDSKPKQIENNVLTKSEQVEETTYKSSKKIRKGSKLEHLRQILNDKLRQKKDSDSEVPETKREDQKSCSHATAETPKANSSHKRKHNISDDSEKTEKMSAPKPKQRKISSTPEIDENKHSQKSKESNSNTVSEEAEKVLYAKSKRMTDSEKVEQSSSKHNDVSDNTEKEVSRKPKYLNDCTKIEPLKINVRAIPEFAEKLASSKIHQVEKNENAKVEKTQKDENPKHRDSEKRNDRTEEKNQKCAGEKPKDIEKKSSEASERSHNNFSKKTEKTEKNKLEKVEPIRSKASSNVDSKPMKASSEPTAESRSVDQVRSHDTAEPIQDANSKEKSVEKTVEERNVTESEENDVSLNDSIMEILEKVARSEEEHSGEAGASESSSEKTRLSKSPISDQTKSRPSIKNEEALPVAEEAKGNSDSGASEPVVESSCKTEPENEDCHLTSINQLKNFRKDKAIMGKNGKLEMKLKISEGGSLIITPILNNEVAAKKNESSDPESTKVSIEIKAEGKVKAPASELDASNSLEKNSILQEFSKLSKPSKFLSEHKEKWLSKEFKNSWQPLQSFREQKMKEKESNEEVPKPSRKAMPSLHKINLENNKCSGKNSLPKEKNDELKQLLSGVEENGSKKKHVTTESPNKSPPPIITIENKGGEYSIKQTNKESLKCENGKKAMTLPELRKEEERRKELKRTSMKTHFEERDEGKKSRSNGDRLESDTCEVIDLSKSDNNMKPREKNPLENLMEMARKPEMPKMDENMVQALISAAQKQSIEPLLKVPNYSQNRNNSSSSSTDKSISPYDISQALQFFRELRSDLKILENKNEVNPNPNAEDLPKSSISSEMIRLYQQHLELIKRLKRQQEKPSEPENPPQKIPKLNPRPEPQQPVTPISDTRPRMPRKRRSYPNFSHYQPQNSYQKGFMPHQQYNNFPNMSQFYNRPLAPMPSPSRSHAPKIRTSSQTPMTPNGTRPRMNFQSGNVAPSMQNPDPSFFNSPNIYSYINTGLNPEMTFHQMFQNYVKQQERINQLKKSVALIASSGVPPPLMPPKTLPSCYYETLYNSKNQKSGSISGNQTQ